MKLIFLIEIREVGSSPGGAVDNEEGRLSSAVVTDFQAALRVLLAATYKF